MVAKSVVDIQVNDEAFKRFRDLFEKYKTGIGEANDKWAESAGAVDAISVSFLAVTAALTAHAELLHKQTEEQKAQAKIEKERADALKRQHRDEQESENRRKRAIQQYKDIA